VHLAIYFMYGLVFLLIALLFAHLIWFRRVALDIPVALRLALSVIPSLVAYRALRAFYTLAVAPSYWRHQGRPGSRPGPQMLVWFLLIAGTAGVFLYHIWRNVSLGDFKRRAHFVPFLRGAEISSPKTSASPRETQA